MQKCKNIECNNEIKCNRVYCSMKCRNYYVNKFIRDYSKNSEGLSKEVKNEYELNPKYCINTKCGKKLSYEKRINQYCGHSCKANNLNPNRKGSKHKISNEGLINLKKSAYKNLLKVNIEISIKNELEYLETPKLCKHCSNYIPYNKRNKIIFCSKECVKKFKRKDMDAFKIYKSDTKFNFSLNSYPSEFDFSLIEKFGWYSPSNSKNPNIEGISRDHMISVMEGFELSIDPKILAHPANCKLMKHSENISKNKKSTLTIGELKEKIINWKLKYND